jgi:hypothetical protein
VVEYSGAGKAETHCAQGGCHPYVHSLEHLERKESYIFQGVFMAPGQVFFMIKEEMQLREVAMGGRASAV